MTFAAVSEKRLQLVPNWNGMTIPDTTPRPKEIAKILIQNTEKIKPFEHRDVECESHRECREQNMERNDPEELEA